MYFFQTLVTMADTYLKANNDEKLAAEIRDFALRFGEKTSVIKKVSSIVSFAQAVVPSINGLSDWIGFVWRRHQGNCSHRCT